MTSSKTVLILGGSGFIGSHLALKLRDDYKVFATYRSNPIQIQGVTCLPLDLRDPDWTKRVIYTASPDILVYAVGSNSVRWTESHAKTAERVHVSYLSPVLKAATIFQPKVIYLSNAQVFDGLRGNYKEGDTVLASSALGKMKVSGENYVRSRALNYSIVRLSPFYGRGNGNRLSFVDRIRMALGRGHKVSADQSEIHSFSPVQSAIEFITRNIEGGPRNKILHYGGITKCTRFELAQAFAKRFKFDASLIIPAINPGAYASSPGDFSLNSTEALRTLALKPMLLEEGFDELERNLDV